MQMKNVVKEKVFTDNAVNKVTHLKTDSFAQDTYYFKPGQVLDYHRHPQGDQVFFVHEGKGTFFIDDNGEKSVKLEPGVVALAPKNVWHKVVADTELIVSQATPQPAGMEKKA